MSTKNIKYLLICILIIFFLLFTSGCVYLEPPSQVPGQQSPQPTVQSPAATNPGWALPTPGVQNPPLPDFASVVSKVKPSVVAINVEIVAYDIFNRPFTEEGAGSGWILDKDGHIATNNHVVTDANKITVTMDDGTALSASVVGTDPLSDIAVIKVDRGNLPASVVGDSSKMRVGDWVLAIGNALGLGITAKEGIVSRKNVSIQVSSNQTLYNLIETSAPINPGNSGGPLVNMAGEVIGITSAKLSDVNVEGLGYAISIDGAKPVIEELIRKGYVTRPFLGVVVDSVNPTLVLRYSLAVNQGAFLVRVVPGGPADKAGLKAGDVIVEMDGKQVTDSPSMLRAIHDGKIGVPTSLTYYRGNSENTTTITPVESPPP